MNTHDIIADIEARAKALKVSVGDVCREAKVAPITFRRWRNGTASPTLATLDKLQAVLAAKEMKKAS